MITVVHLRRGVGLLVLAAAALPGSVPAQEQYRAAQARRITVQQLILDAYAGEGIVAPSQIVGAPHWLAEDWFDARAGAHEGPAQLLATQFGLRVHFEERDDTVYELTRLRTGVFAAPRMRPSICRQLAAQGQGSGHRVSCPPLRVGADSLMESISMAELARLLSRRPEISRPVRDATALPGTYDVDLEWANGSLTGARPATRRPWALSLPLAVETQLGLTFREATARIRVLVIDQVVHPGAVSLSSTLTEPAASGIAR